MKISVKLFAITLLVSLLLGAGFAANNMWLRTLGNDFRTFIDKDRVLSAAVDGMNIQALQSELAIRNLIFDPKDDAAIRNLQTAGEDFDKALKTAQALSAQDGDGSADLSKLDQLWRETGTIKENIRSLTKEGKHDEAIGLLQKERPIWRSAKLIIVSLKVKTDKRLQVRREYIGTFTKSATLKSSLISLLVIGVVIFIMLRFSMYMRKTINGLAGQIRDMLNGNIDLTKRIEYRNKDEFGELVNRLNNLFEHLHDLVLEVSQNAVKVSGAAGKILTNSQFMSAAANESAIQAGTIATASEEMAATSNDIANNCHGAATNSRLSSERALFGSNVVRESISIMARIANQVKQAAVSIGELGVRSNQIGDIVNTIEDIADQTNLLALNAAIEAARAGEQGRGFAVVADEVRALAERTTRATKEIAQMITSIQQHTGEAVAIMEQGVLEVEKGSGEASRSGQALEEILEQINNVSMQVSQIATAAEEQTATSSDISANIQQMNNAVAKTSKNALESTQEASELGKLAEALQEEVKSFRTAESDVLILDIAKNDHRLFVNRIRSAVNGDLQLEADNVANHHQCRFGKWYDGDGKDLCGNLESFKAINAPHERIHAISKEAVAAISAGDRRKAESLAAQVEDLSYRIVDSLSEIKRDYSAYRT